MAEALVGYKGNLNPLTISQDETVRALRKKDTRVAATKTDTSNRWAENGKAIGSAMQLATNIANVANYAHMKTKQEKQQAKIDSAQTIRSGNTSNTNDFSKFLNDRAMKVNEPLTTEEGQDVTDRFGETYDFSNVGTLKAIGKWHTATTTAINDNDDYSPEEKKLMIDHLESVIDAKVISYSKAAQIDAQNSNNFTTDGKLHSLNIESFSSPKVSLEQLVDNAKEHIESYKANGKPNADIFQELRTTVNVYKHDAAIIGTRFKEAQQYMEAQTDAGKPLSEGFIAYYSDLQSADVANTRRDKKLAREVTTTEKAVATKEYKKIAYEVSDIPKVSFNVDANSIKNTTIEQSFVDIKEGLRGGAYETALIRAGKSPTEIEIALDKYSETVVYKLAHESFKDGFGGQPPVNLFDGKWKEMVTLDIQQDIDESLKNGKPYVINGMFKDNPKVVSDYMSNYITKGYQGLIGAGDPEEYEARKAALFGSFSNLDNQLLDQAISDSDQVKLDIIQKYPQEAAMAALTKLNKGEHLLTKTSFDKSTKSFLNQLPIEDRKEVTESLLADQFVSGYIDTDKYKKKLALRTHNGSVMTRGLSTKYGTEGKRDTLFYVLKQESTLGEIPDGSRIEEVNGNIRVTFKGTTLRSMPIKQVDTQIKAEEDRALSESAWDKSRDNDHWYSWLFRTYSAKQGFKGTVDGEVNPYRR